MGLGPDTIFFFVSILVSVAAAATAHAHAPARALALTCSSKLNFILEQRHLQPGPDLNQPLASFLP